jgi:hypothetical protein
MSSSPPDSEPLLPPPATHLSSASRSKLAARRFLRSERSKGKQRAEPDLTPNDEDEPDVEAFNSGGGGKEGLGMSRTGRNVTVIFSNESDSGGGGGNLEIWVEEGESVGSVKEQVGLSPHHSLHFPPSLSALNKAW